MKTINSITLFLLMLLPVFSMAQKDIQKSLVWEDSPLIHTFANQETVEIWRFKDAAYHAEHPTLPTFYTQFPVSSFGRLSVQVIETEWEPFNKLAAEDDAALSNRLSFETAVEQEGQNFIGTLSFIPIRKTATGYERLLRFRLQVNFSAESISTLTRDDNNTYTSVLNDGEVYKIGVTETGIQKLSFSFLTTELGMNLNGVDPRNISVYGNGGGMLPERIETARIDDLEENPILIVGEEDGSFDSGDYILFYGESQDKWYFEPESKTFYMKKNIYEVKNYYFIKVGSDNGRRIETQNSINTTAYTSETFNDYQHYEEDLLNLMDAASSTQGSGKDWYGDFFKNINEQTYDFDFSNLVTNSPILVKARMAGRSSSSTKFTVAAGGENFVSANISGVPVDNPTEKTYAEPALSTGAFRASDDKVSITIKYPTNNSGSVISTNTEGWLDYIELNARRRLNMTGQQMAFRDTTALSFNSTTYRLSNANANLLVWDISNPLVPVNQNFTLNGSQINFGANTSNGLKEFIAFDKNQGITSAEAIGKIEPQNVHATDNVTLVIVYHQDFEEQTKRLAEHRRTYSNMDVATVRVDKLYNEFSSGKQDPTAIRDFGKMIYERNPDKFKYMLLFGDGSFDFRNIKGGTNSSFIPVYETDKSLNPINAFPSDDFFSLISDNEGQSNLSGKMDFSVGRLPVKTDTEARNVVDKIINYEMSPSTLGDWRNRLVFVADDEDRNLHLDDADLIAELADSLYRGFNQDKIYLDAYPQVSTSGGEGFPTVTEAINRAMFKGMLAVNYLGHGGSDGWTQERVLDKDRGDIINWSNFDKLPLFITATCSFAGFDDRNKVTAGEQVLLNEKGGGIALFTTTRAVFASSNAQLVKSVFDTMLYKINGERPTLGDIFLIGKNTTSATTENSRKFNLLGDPSMQLAIPKYNVVTNQIDDHVVSDGLSDTLKALQKVTISGDIRDKDGRLLDDFNGTLFPTLFDKRVTYSTLGQDPKSYVEDFTLQKNVIFKGRASITNGKWSFTFVVPKDINYELGPGKISYYAHNGETDAAGNYEKILIGGTDANALADDQGPEVEVFMNTEDFVFGGITDPNPTLLVKLEDDNGINVAGNSIGHDLEGVLDENTQSTYLLNDFYEAALDDYTKGEVRYPLSDLKDGLHNISVRAWDVANNSAQGYTEFLVTSSDKVALEHVLNYPNPFMDATCFQFDHNMANQEMEVLIQIFTVGGRLVKTIETQLVSDGAIRQDDCIQWDGLDDYGDRLGRGVYLYKVKVRTLLAGDAAFSGESEFEKLVILR